MLSAGAGAPRTKIAVWPSDHRRRSASCEGHRLADARPLAQARSQLAALTDRPLPGTLHCAALLGVILPRQTG